MTNLVSKWTGSAGAEKAAQNAAWTSEVQAQLAQNASQAQEARAQSDQGQQLALLSRQQAIADNSAAAASGPRIGRAIMGYERRTKGTLGG